MKLQSEIFYKNNVLIKELLKFKARRRFCYLEILNEIQEIDPTITDIKKSYNGERYTRRENIIFTIIRNNKETKIEFTS